MKYVALLSGGKDSCYNLLHCHRNGHQLVAAASLGPEHGKEELDSYLYQTVGQDAIELVARALDVPLYRRVISGAAVEQGSEYGGRSSAESGGVEGDETEDLYVLLSTVKNHHPDVEGVSVGAILSNYQRVRVEHVCRRLGLTPLCYLWQRDQAELLAEMIEAGMEAILIKVAGIGLSVKHLGKTLAEMQPTLTKLNDLYGSHICGEGGEYETLTLDCPLFKHRIKLTEVETVIHSDSDFAVVAYLRIKNATLEPKPTFTTVGPAVPSLLTEQFQEVHEAVAQSLITVSSSEHEDTNDQANEGSVEHPALRTTSKQVGRWVAVADITRALTPDAAEISLDNEVRECFQVLSDRLHAHSLRLQHVSSLTVLLSSMSLFARVNAVYATHFGTAPPARACVAADLPAPLRVKLEAVAYAEVNAAERTAMHVQGLSYWAPANIGPYSQAIVVDQRIFISGQIGLVPSSLALPAPPSLALETALAFQHAERVVDALKSNSGGGWAGCEQGALYWLVNAGDVCHVRAAVAAFRPDVPSPTLFLVVPALPKGALVEKQVLMHTGQCMMADEDDSVLQSVTAKFVQGDIANLENGRIHWEISTFNESTSSVALICFRGDVCSIASGLKNVPSLQAVLQGALSVRLFYKPSGVSSFRQTFDAHFRPSSELPITSIPCHHIASRDFDDWDYAMFIIGV
ncbi:hypothetical protein WOLCODRAFT_143406 [Wolfiporia cocos MD-104 SS10]|uniref:Diphthine--ammonia ligase n=1 Tax=Wolfiporia cocos (strain MD-104) TaxID=742152 RepID=A0A2H3JG09_WOLCO|nr:hypothetical protein WOLCODRAFT_143406 [Wolfiporia cocos MD-104 SS10]